MIGKHRRDTLSIAEEAAEWLDALQDGDAEVNAAFVKWLRASPRHVEEFLFVTASEQLSEGIDADRRMDVEQMIAAMSANVVDLETSEAAPATPKAPLPAPQFRWRWAAGIVAVAAGLALAVGSFALFDGWQTYAAAVGEQRIIELADGSLIHLNARSRVAARLSDSRRDVRLLEGEALFKVAHDAARPFRVDAGSIVIRALGTQFNVDRHVDDTKVAVIEGVVEITASGRTLLAPAQRPRVADKQDSSSGSSSPAQLVAGEEARIASSGEITRAKANVAEALAWQQRRLIFRDSTLAEIVLEFNRYNRTPQLVIADDALRTQRYGGTFDADEPKSLVEFLRRTPGLSVAQEGDRLVIRSR